MIANQCVACGRDMPEGGMVCGWCRDRFLGSYTVDGVQVRVWGDEFIQMPEVLAYVERGIELYGSIQLMDVKVEGDEVMLHYQVDSRPFERIRRITGYLVGDTSRWNNAKAQELHDRVMHDKDDSAAAGLLEEY